MALIAIDDLNEDIMKFFENTAKKHKKKFIFFDIACQTDYNKKHGSLCNSVIVFKNPDLTDKEMIKFFGKSRPLGNNIIYRTSNFGISPVTFMTDFFAVAGRKQIFFFTKNFTNNRLSLVKEVKI